MSNDLTRRPEVKPEIPQGISKELRRFIIIYGHEFFGALEAMQMMKNCMDLGEMGTAATWARRAASLMNEPGREVDRNNIKRKGLTQVDIIREIVEIYRTEWTASLGGEVAVADRATIHEVMARFSWDEATATRRLAEYHGMINRERRLESGTTVREIED